MDIYGYKNDKAAAFTIFWQVLDAQDVCLYFQKKWSGGLVATLKHDHLKNDNDDDDELAFNAQ